MLNKYCKRLFLIIETPTQNKPVASPAAHSLLANGSAGGKMSMGSHHYMPSIPVNINTTQPHYNSLVSSLKHTLIILISSVVNSIL